MSSKNRVKKHRLLEELKSKFLLDTEDAFTISLLSRLADDILNMEALQKDIEERGTVVINRYGDLTPNPSLQARKSIQGTISQQLTMLQKLKVDNDADNGEFNWCNWNG